MIRLAGRISSNGLISLYKHVSVWFLIHYLNSSYDNVVYSTAEYISVRKTATSMQHIYILVYLCNEIT